MAVRYDTRWDGRRFTSKPLQDLLNARKDWSLVVLVKSRQNKPPAGLHGYYRGILIPALTECMAENGHEGRSGGPIQEDEVHHLLKLRYLVRSTWDEARQRYVHYLMSTADLTADEFSDYVLRVERWMVDFWDIAIDDRDFRTSSDKAKWMREYFNRAT